MSCEGPNPPCGRIQRAMCQKINRVGPEVALEEFPGPSSNSKFWENSKVLQLVHRHSRHFSECSTSVMMTCITRPQYTMLVLQLNYMKEKWEKGWELYGEFNGEWWISGHQVVYKWSPGGLQVVIFIHMLASMLKIYIYWHKCSCHGRNSGRQTTEMWRC